ncbi:hypothetical protein DPMN_015716 [Dreissena polymorpha]|uniref:Uncharacterized protein n=1 Tax=Dreissena polymorpha TaxID=45954 RepID=A0A9D4NE64_DREPO|nr:hypothetical protein DPMN_015716 [Dreissena polymorpha]
MLALCGVIFVPTHGLTCYVCGEMDAGCEDTFTTATQKDGCTVCSKQKYWAFGSQVVTRTCFKSLESIGCSNGKVGGYYADICYCHTHLCNSGYSVSIITKMMCLWIFSLSVFTVWD